MQVLNRIDLRIYLVIIHLQVVMHQFNNWQNNSYKVLIIITYCLVFIYKAITHLDLLNRIINNKSRSNNKIVLNKIKNNSNNKSSNSNSKKLYKSRIKK
jgi:multisubunit Na+/H+ antiporter MnhE subunit